MPFNMNTFNKMWGVVTPAEAMAKIEEQRAAHFTPEPKNLEEQAINLVGVDIYEKLVKGYTEKQWGRPLHRAAGLYHPPPAGALHLRQQLFQRPVQGIPNGGYTKLVEKMLEGVEVRLNTNYLQHKAELDALAGRVIYTGPIDAYFDYCLGALQYRSVRSRLRCWTPPTTRATPLSTTPTPRPPTPASSSTSTLSSAPAQNRGQPGYSAEWKPGDEPYYPVNDEANDTLYAKYKAMADAEPHVVFGGRLGEYKYYDNGQGHRERPGPLCGGSRTRSTSTSSKHRRKRRAFAQDGEADAMPKKKNNTPRPAWNGCGTKWRPTA